MSEAEKPPAIPSWPPDSLPGAGPPPPRSGCLTAFMFIFGIILLLPGLCAVIFGLGTLFGSNPFGEEVFFFVLVGLLVGYGGIMLIRSALR